MPRDRSRPSSSGPAGPKATREAGRVAETERLRGVRAAQAVETAHTQQPARRGGEQEVSASTGAGTALDSVADLARRLYPELYDGG